MLITHKFKHNLLALAIMSVAMPSFAEGDLDEIIVTGVAGETKKMEATVSVSSIKPEAIAEFAPRSTAEIFKTLPGIRAESSSGEGNSNLSIRGLPNPSGGARYLALQENGLPLVLFGDINFGTADSFFRYDTSVAKVEAVRGGAAATLTSNSAGGIVNFIDKTGKEEGGSIALTRGLDYDSTRVDYEAGGHLTDTVRFHIGGFTRQGDGARDVGYTAESGGQFSANITKEFESGFATVSYKKLDDKAIPYLPAAVDIKGKGVTGKFGSFDTFDVAQSKYLLQTHYIDAEGNYGTSSLQDGMHPIVEDLGTEFQFDLGDGYTVNYKGRNSTRSGTWTGAYQTGFTTAAQTNPNGTGFRYVNGPDQGKAYTGTDAQVIQVFDVTIKDASINVQDLRLTAQYSDNIKAVYGLFWGQQKFDQDWHWSEYLTESKGKDEAVVDVVDAAGNALTDGGLRRYGSSWGGCCTHHDDLSFDVVAPYAALNLTFDQLTIDAGVRYDKTTVTGVAHGMGTTPKNVGDVNGDGHVSFAEANANVTSNASANEVTVNADDGNTSYNLGANYLIGDNMAVFGSYTQAWRAQADRAYVGSAIIGAAADYTAPSDDIRTAEVGMKFNYDTFDVFATVFKSKVSATTNDFTQTPSNVDQDYDINGIELEASTSIGSFKLNGNVTWTDAKGTNKITHVTTVPRRQADFIYYVSAGYDFGDIASIGVNLNGSTDSNANNGDNAPGQPSTPKMPGYNVLGAYANYYVTDKFTLSLNVNNLTNEVVVTESGGPSYRVGNPRTTSVTAKFTF